MAFPNEIQRNQMDCGATCLRIISRHFGKVIPLAHLRSVTNTGRSGTSLLGISKGAEDLGFRTMGIKTSFAQLRRDAPLPFIAHWDQSHFVVVYRITGKQVYVSDPAQGLVAYRHGAFLAHWIDAHATPDSAQGLALLLEPTPAFEEQPIKGQDEKIDVCRFLLHYIRPHRRLLGQVMLGLAAASIMQLFIPFLTQSIVDTGIYKKDISFIWLVLIAQLALTLGQLMLELLRGWMLLHISSRLNITLISDFFIKLMRLPIRFFDTRLTGDLMQRIQDHYRIEEFLTGTTLSALFSTFTLVLYSAVLAYYNAGLFLIFFIGNILYVSWVFFFLRRRERLDYGRFQQSGAAQSKVFELINGMQVIKLHNAEQQKRWGWERLQVKLFRNRMQSLSLEQIQSSGSRIINEVRNILVSAVAAKLVIDGKLTLGAMLAVSYIIGQLNSPVLQLVGVIKSWQDARISLDRIAEIHVKDDEAGSASGAAGGPGQPLASEYARPVPRHQDITLEGVSFGYDPLSDHVLKDITLCLPAGKVTAIVGSSGSGKTTLLKLLMRFYEPVKGRILIGNTDLKQTDLAGWRSCCGTVMQEGFLFNDTIAGNIAVGDEHPEWDRLIEACRIANILSFIEDLPLDFNTRIGQEGMGISGGQQQRILIARAVYKNPDILFFDEATSSLDANNERKIMEHLEQFYKGKTVVVIAHRLSTVKNADNIIVLEQGRIVEEGDHEMLTGNKGYYYQLVRNQLELGS